MSTTIEERILDLVEAALTAITTGAGFEQTVKKVERATQPDPPMEFDIATQVPGLQIRHETTTGEPHLRGALECRMDLKIVCIAEYSTDEEKISDLIGSVIDVLLTNRRWDAGGSTFLARRTWVTGAFVHETETNESPVTGEVNCSILFRVDATDPFAVKEI
jgi:hypothetical protein